MAGRAPADDEVANLQPPLSSSSSPSSDTTATTRSDPPPPLPTDLDNPTPSEESALDSWIRRNPTYLTTIRWYRYPALPVLSPLWGYTDNDFRAEVLESLLFYTRASGRRLTDAERDAVLEPITRDAVAASYDRPAALGLAGWLMARSWRKSGIKHAAGEMVQQQTMGMGTGAVDAAGHITHFSGGQQTPQQQQPMARSMAGFVVRRVARMSFVGLTCAAGYYALWTPWRFLLGNHEVDTIREDLRLERMCEDLDRNMKDKMADMLRRHGG